MNNFKNKITILLVTVMVVASSCADLSVDNVNQPNREQALASDSDLVSLLNGGANDVFFIINYGYTAGVSINAYADMMTTTNMVNSWWVWTDEPRRMMPNRPTFPDMGVIDDMWGEFNSGIQSANTVLGILSDGGTIEVDGVDLTADMEANALLIRGLAKLYKGMIYDQGYDVTEESDLSVVEFAPYTELIDSGIADLEDYLTKISAIDGYVFDLLPSPEDWTADEMNTIVNGFLARGLAAKARTNAEAEAIDWQQVLTYADRAPGGDNAVSNLRGRGGFVATTVGSYVFYHDLLDWNTYILGGSILDPDPEVSETANGYLPPDIMINHALDPNYPTAYPTGSDEFLVEDDFNSSDPRAAYLAYTPSRFAQSADRNKALFTQYVFLREWGGNNWGQTGQPLVFYLNAETSYLKAEAYLRLDDKINAANVLNNSPFGSGETDISPDLVLTAAGINNPGDGLSGGNTISATASDAEFQYALLREYAVEISLMGGVGSQWHFMRRWDMLQIGTPTQYPVPASELEVTTGEYYTFGGVQFAGEPGTASGDNSWKDLVSKVPNPSTAFWNTNNKNKASFRPLNFNEVLEKVGDRMNLSNSTGNKNAKVQ
ncbi:MAG: hypothetical protein WD357_12010 [Gracilimonas sp.]